MLGPAASTIAYIYIQDHEQTTISTALHPPKVWQQFVDDFYFVLKCNHIKNFFNHYSNLHQNITFTMEEKNDGETAFLNTSLKQETIKERSQYWNKGSLGLLTNTYNCNESVIFSLFNRAHSIIINKNDFHKESARIKQVLNYNGYQERITSKTFKRTTNNQSLPHS